VTSRAGAKPIFVRAIRNAVRPDGSRLAPSMPRDYREVTDLELAAVWRYAQSLPPVPARQ
jgi:hypothetical protein